MLKKNGPDLVGAIFINIQMHGFGCEFSWIAPAAWKFPYAAVIND